MKAYSCELLSIAYLRCNSRQHATAREIEIRDLAKEHGGSDLAGGIDNIVGFDELALKVDGRLANTSRLNLSEREGAERGRD